MLAIRQAEVYKLNIPVQRTRVPVQDFSSGAWQRAIARLVASGSGSDAAPALVGAIDAIVRHQGTCLIAFHEDAGPEVLHHTLEPEGEQHYLGRYLAGPYLLDPLYQLALSRTKPGICRYRDATPDRFHSSEYYRQYCERTHLGDEIDYLLDVADGSAVVLVVACRDKRFTRTEIERLRNIQPVVHAGMRNAWDYHQSRNEDGAGDDEVHRRLTACFANFGADSLTEREREITQHLLRGYSTKAIAGQLGIAPGTVMVHKRNLFSKLGITSQYELFSQFIESLSDTPG
jgi:DNA-binding CsgD family transcriptional regulator